MATRRALTSVLSTFLGTYVSRYSDYDGYWLFGFLVDGTEELRIDLLDETAFAVDSPAGLARRSATTKFAEQCKKAGIVRSQLNEATLTITRLPGKTRGPVNGRPTDGYQLQFVAVAVTDLGRRFARDRTVFVAPHDPAVELRSARAGEGAG